MKKLLILSIVALTTPLAMACPDLTGAYSCQDTSGESWEITLTTTLENGVYVYTADDFKLYADGNSHDFTNEYMRGTYVGTCAGNALSVASQGDLLEHGKSVGTFQMTNVSTKSATGYTEASEGSAVYMGQSFPINEQSTCQLN